MLSSWFICFYTTSSLWRLGSTEIFKPPKACSKRAVSVLLFSGPVASDWLRPHGLQHAGPPCPSPSPEVWSSCPLHWWCHPAVSSSDALFSFCPQSFPASGTFPMSQLFTSDDQNTGGSASASVLPISIQSWFPLWFLPFSFSAVENGSRPKRHISVGEWVVNFPLNLLFWIISHVQENLSKISKTSRAIYWIARRPSPCFPTGVQVKFLGTHLVASSLLPVSVEFRIYHSSVTLYISVNKVLLVSCSFRIRNSSRRIVLSDGWEPI